jgi:hypothetical protein
VHRCRHHLVTVLVRSLSPAVLALAVSRAVLVVSRAVLVVSRAVLVLSPPRGTPSQTLMARRRLLDTAKTRRTVATGVATEAGLHTGTGSR